MLLTIHNLPSYTQVKDVKKLLLDKCGLKDIVLDNLVMEMGTMKITVGVAEEEEAAIVTRKINGMLYKGKHLYVQDIRQKRSEKEHRVSLHKRPTFYKSSSSSSKVSISSSPHDRDSSESPPPVFKKKIAFTIPKKSSTTLPIKPSVTLPTRPGIAPPLNPGKAPPLNPGKLPLPETSKTPPLNPGVAMPLNPEFPQKTGTASPLNQAYTQNTSIATTQNAGIAGQIHSGIPLPQTPKNPLLPTPGIPLPQNSGIPLPQNPGIASLNPGIVANSGIAPPLPPTNQVTQYNATQYPTTTGTPDMQQAMAAFSMMYPNAPNPFAPFVHNAALTAAPTPVPTPAPIAQDQSNQQAQQYNQPYQQYEPSNQQYNQYQQYAQQNNQPIQQNIQPIQQNIQPIQQNGQPIQQQPILQNNQLIPQNNQQMQQLQQYMQQYQQFQQPQYAQQNQDQLAALYSNVMNWGQQQPQFNQQNYQQDQTVSFLNNLMSYYQPQMNQPNTQPDQTASFLNNLSNWSGNNQPNQQVNQQNPPQPEIVSRWDNPNLPTSSQASSKTLVNTSIAKKEKSPHVSPIFVTNTVAKKRTWSEENQQFQKQQTNITTVDKKDDKEKRDMSAPPPKLQWTPVEPKEKIAKIVPIDKSIFTGPDAKKKKRMFYDALYSSVSALTNTAYKNCYESVEYTSAEPCLARQWFKKQLFEQIAKMLKEKMRTKEEVILSYRTMFSEDDDANYYMFVKHKIDMGKKETLGSLKFGKLSRAQKYVAKQIRFRNKDAQEMNGEQSKWKMYQQPEDIHEKYIKRTGKSNFPKSAQFIGYGEKTMLIPVFPKDNPSLYERNKQLVSDEANLKPYPMHENIEQALDLELEILGDILQKVFDDEENDIYKCVYDNIATAFCVEITKKVLKVHLSKRISNKGPKIVYIRAKNNKSISRLVLENFLMPYDCVALEKSNKINGQQGFDATFALYDKSDELIIRKTADVGEKSNFRTIFFSYVIPLKKAISEYHRQKELKARISHIHRLVDKSNVNLLDKNWQNTQTIQEQNDDENIIEILEKRDNKGVNELNSSGDDNVKVENSNLVNIGADKDNSAQVNNEVKDNETSGTYEEVRIKKEVDDDVPENDVAISKNVAINDVAQVKGNENTEIAQNDNVIAKAKEMVSLNEPKSKDDKIANDKTIGVNEVTCGYDENIKRNIKVECNDDDVCIIDVDNMEVNVKLEPKDDEVVSKSNNVVGGNELIAKHIKVESNDDDDDVCIIDVDMEVNVKLEPKDDEIVSGSNIVGGNDEILAKNIKVESNDDEVLNDNKDIDNEAGVHDDKQEAAHNDGEKSKNDNDNEAKGDEEGVNYNNERLHNDNQEGINNEEESVTNDDGVHNNGQETNNDDEIRHDDEIENTENENEFVDNNEEYQDETGYDDGDNENCDDEYQENDEYQDGDEQDGDEHHEGDDDYQEGQYEGEEPMVEDEGDYEEEFDQEVLDMDEEELKKAWGYNVDRNESDDEPMDEDDDDDQNDSNEGKEQVNVDLETIDDDDLEDY